MLVLFHYYNVTYTRKAKAHPTQSFKGFINFYHLHGDDKQTQNRLFFIFRQNFRHVHAISNTVGAVMLDLAKSLKSPKIANTK